VHRKLITAAAIAAAATAMSGLATAGGTATRQEIALTYANGNAAKMTLTPLTSGSVVADHGSTSWCCWTQKTVQQDGEQLDVNNPLATFVGTRGSLTWREQVTWHDLTNGYSVATGTWRIVRGSGAYQHLTGQGHVVFISGSGDKVLTYRAIGLIVPRG
jgi:ABC-type transport system substrate-binding protein